jgi:hypothetical protein
VYDKDCIYFIDGWWTKLAHFFVIPSEYEAPQTTELFFREVSRLHGFPEYVDSVGTTHFPIYFGRGYADWREES